MKQSYKPKLIEVALPLADVNAASVREKSLRHGHPSTLHLWWARRPLAAARAVVWASLVDDPSGDESLTAEQIATERKRLFAILSDLVVWENSNNPDVLGKARAEIDRCFPDGCPPILDPFGGGGAIPLEVQRLGLEAWSGDLNPVAVLIQKAMVEIPPRFAARSPVYPGLDQGLGAWSRAQGLAADVAAYGRWMRDQAAERIGQLYPDATGPTGEKFTPIAWIWARTVASPDPAWKGPPVPLVASWTLANRPKKPKVWIEPIVDRAKQRIRYEIRTGGEPCVERTSARGIGTCLATGAVIPNDYIKAEGHAGRLGQQLIAVVGEGQRRRVYCVATNADEEAAAMATPEWFPDGQIPHNPQYMGAALYGMAEWKDLFTPRQLTALTTFSDLLAEVRERVVADASAAGWSTDTAALRDGGDGAAAYAEAIVTYLAFVVDKCADYWSTICIWNNKGEKMAHTFGRQAIPISWDFAEANPFSESSGSWLSMLGWVKKAIDHLPAAGGGQAVQRDARVRVAEATTSVVSTDPPYYDNISYADLSDYFFTWLRRNLADVWPDECATLTTPKADELIAHKYRAGSKLAAAEHFESGMAEFMAAVAKTQHPLVPATIYYAYKATETKNGQTRSTGWATFLQAVIDAGFQITATWPLRTEMPSRLRATGSNALASSIVLVVRPRPVGAARASTGEFVAALRLELPAAVRVLQAADIAPVDMAQSTIGPGIGIFSRYAQVVEATGTPMSVSDALAHVNQVLAEILDETEAELDPHTRFAVAWYDQHGYNPAPSGDAISIAQAKNTTMEAARDAGLGKSVAGKFQLYERCELPSDWTPLHDDTPTVWEETQYLVAKLAESESDAAKLLAQLRSDGEQVRALAYLLFQKATLRGWADEANAYNSLVMVWPRLVAMASADQQQSWT